MIHRYDTKCKNAKMLRFAKKKRPGTGVAARLPLRRGIGVYGVNGVKAPGRGIWGKRGKSSSRGYTGYMPSQGVNGVNA